MRPNGYTEIDGKVVFTRWSDANQPAMRQWRTGYMVGWGLGGLAGPRIKGRLP